MDDDFKIDPKPVYEGDQILTHYDLLAIRNGYIYSYHLAVDDTEKYKFLVAVGVMDRLIKFLKSGKKDGEII